MPPSRPSPSGKDATGRIRKLALSFPDVSEKLSHGEATFFASGRSFAMMADRHHDDRVAVWLAAGDGVQADLARRAPERYFRPPYVGARGWVGCYLDGRDEQCDWDEIAELVADAHDLIARPRRRP